MLIIRLQRVGKKKHPTYRLVISEKNKDTQSGSLEILGNYNPVAQPKILTLKKDRISYWLSKGAQTSATVHNLFLKEGLVTGEKRRSIVISKTRKAKLAGKKKTAEPATASASPSPAAPPETPAAPAEAQA